MTKASAPPLDSEAMERWLRKRGRRAENLCDKLLASLREDKKILRFLVAYRFSFLDFLCGIDRVVVRNDGSCVPLGVVSSEDRRIKHEDRYGHAHQKAHGSITPVAVVATSNRVSLFRLKYWLACVIDGYKGTFTYEPWMLKYDESFDVVRNPDISLDRRVELFWRNRRKKSR